MPLLKGKNHTTGYDEAFIELQKYAQATVSYHLWFCLFVFLFVSLFVFLFVSLFVFDKSLEIPLLQKAYLSHTCGLLAT
jgi:hypothetical protein